MYYIMDSITTLNDAIAFLNNDEGKRKEKFPHITTFWGQFLKLYRKQMSKLVMTALEGNKPNMIRISQLQSNYSCSTQ